MRPSAFICYRREAFWAARAVKSHFEARGWRVFLDLDDLHSEWGPQLEKRLVEADVILALIHPDWTACFPEEAAGAEDADVLFLELFTAIENETLIAPVLLGNAEMPSPRDLPEKLHGLLQYDFRPLPSEHAQDGMRKLALAVEKGVKERRGALTLRRYVGMAMRSWLQLAVAASVILAAVILTFWLSAPEDAPIQLVVVEDEMHPLIGGVTSQCKVVTWDNYRGQSLLGKKVNWHIEKDLKEIKLPADGTPNPSVTRARDVLAAHEARGEDEPEYYLDTEWRHRGFNALSELVSLARDFEPGKEVSNAGGAAGTRNEKLVALRSHARTLERDYSESFKLFPRNGQLSYTQMTLAGAKDLELVPNHEEKSLENFLAKLGPGPRVPITPVGGKHYVCMFRGDAIEFKTRGRRWRLVVTSIANPGKKWRFPDDDLVGVRLTRID